MKVGAQTRIGVILPGAAALGGAKLSRAAKVRLAWMDYYAGCGNAALTCRRYGISRPTLHKWLKRYHRGDLRSLEERSRAPANKKEADNPDRNRPPDKTAQD